jgi:hypothetical protein
MRRIYVMALLLTLVTFSIADARIKVKGRGNNINFDPDSIPPNFKASYDVMTHKCTRCHTMEMVVTAVQSGKAPVTGQPFDKQAVKAYGIKMLRKSNTDMNKQEIRSVVMLLNYLLDENSK